MWQMILTKKYFLYYIKMNSEFKYILDKIKTSEIIKKPCI